MSELHKFLFEGLPVRGMVVRLTGAWTDMLQRRANSKAGAYPAPVRNMLGEMSAAAVLMQSNIKFDGALILQIFGDGPVKVAVAEVQSDLSLRATASVSGEIVAGASLSQMVNEHNAGRCAITLDPTARLPGQQPYQGVVPLWDDQRRKIDSMAEVLEHYMLQSEQLDTRLVLAADEHVAAGLLIQRLPVAGEGNLAGSAGSDEDEIGLNEHFNRIAILAASLKPQELLTLDVDTILRRLFWEEQIVRFEPLAAERGPRFACSCSRARVGSMIRSLGTAEVGSIVAEQGEVQVDCDYCGMNYRFDAVDAAQVFTDAGQHAPGSSNSH